MLLCAAADAAQRTGRLCCRRAGSFIAQVLETSHVSECDNSDGLSNHKHQSLLVYNTHSCPVLIIDMLMHGS